MVWSIPFDTTPFITASIDEVAKTLLEAMVLVTLVVFLFLQSWRATLIPILAVPVSVIGTFVGLLAFGFSVNVLTLFGLVLAIGIVVDDAIVVIENAERIMADEGLPARQAADKAIRQVAGALVAIVLSLCAVFIPVAFLGGITGSMFRQFTMTIVLAVVLSGLTALTLTPALCAMLLKEAPERARHGAFFRWFNSIFGRLRTGYAGAVHPRRAPAPDLAGGLRGDPRADRGALAADPDRVPAAGGQGLLRGRDPASQRGVAAAHPRGGGARRAAGPQRSRHRGDRVAGRARHPHAGQPAQLGGDVRRSSSRGTGAARTRSLDAIVARMNGELYGIPGALAFAFNFPEIPGLGTTAGLELNLQARAGQDVTTFNDQVNAAVHELSQQPELQGVTTNFRIDAPRVYLDVDRDAVKSRNVPLAALFETLQTMLSSLYINDFNLFGRTYRVQADAAPQLPAVAGRPGALLCPQHRRPDDSGDGAGARPVRDRPVAC